MIEDRPMDQLKRAIKELTESIKAYLDYIWIGHVQLGELIKREQQIMDKNNNYENLRSSIFKNGFPPPRE